MVNMQNKKQPLVVAFVADVMWQSKIELVTRHLGFAVQFIEDETQISPADTPSQPARPGEPLDGRKGVLFEQLVQNRPALLIFDLENGHIPWLNWMPTLKSSPATRRIPIVAYAPHVNSQALNQAQSCGADQVVVRGQFQKQMGELLQKWAVVPDYEALASSCDQPLPEIAHKGIELFNSQQFYDCHHALEEAWNEDSGPGRNLYKGILQIAVAYYQIQRGNYNGGAKLLLRMRQWLDPLPDVCRGVPVRQLRKDALQVYEALQAAGRENISQFDQTLFKPIHLL